MQTAACFVQATDFSSGIVQVLVKRELAKVDEHSRSPLTLVLTQNFRHLLSPAPSRLAWPSQSTSCNRPGCPERLHRVCLVPALHCRGVFRPRVRRSRSLSLTDLFAPRPP